MVLSLKACARSASTTTPPRATLISTDERFMRESARVSIRLVVAGVSGQCRHTMSDRASKSSVVA
jgi:hypothetical protein